MGCMSVYDSFTRLSGAGGKETVNDQKERERDKGDREDGHRSSQGRWNFVAAQNENNAEREGR